MNDPFLQVADFTGDIMRSMLPEEFQASLPTGYTIVGDIGKLMLSMLSAYGMLSGTCSYCEFQCI